MPSKLVTDRQKNAEAVAAVGNTHAEHIAQSLSEVLQPFLQTGESMPDFGLIMRLLSRKLIDSKNHMVEADVAHEAELNDDPAIRETRDQHGQALYSRVTEIRDMITGIYGKDVSSRIAKGSTPRDPVVLSRAAEEMSNALTAQPLPVSRIPGFNLDTHLLAHELASLRQSLDSVVTQVAHETREAQLTLAAKNEALQTYDQEFMGIAKTFEGLLISSGQPDQADRVRPSHRSPGRTENDPVSDPSSDPQTKTPSQAA